MCVPCKIIINEGIRALSMALERILTSPDVMTALGPVKSDDYIKRLQEVDLVAYCGGVGNGGLKGIVSDLVRDGILHADVWKLLTQ